MKATYFLVIVLFLTLTSATCKKNKKLDDSGATWTKESFLTITHIGCRGYCPAFTISVNENGSVTYEGKRNVDRLGMWGKKIENDKIKKLKELIVEYKFFEFDSLYGGGVADLPYVIIEVKRDGKVKTVTNIRFAPDSLNELQAKLEEMIGDDGYKEIVEE